MNMLGLPTGGRSIANSPASSEMNTLYPAFIQAVTRLGRAGDPALSVFFFS
jgi:hypothetical protein